MQMRRWTTMAMAVGMLAMTLSIPGGSPAWGTSANFNSRALAMTLKLKKQMGAAEWDRLSSQNRKFLVECELSQKCKDERALENFPRD